MQSLIICPLIVPKVNGKIFKVLDVGQIEIPGNTHIKQHILKYSFQNPNSTGLYCVDNSFFLPE
jgi:hypothetical protein